MLRSPRECVAKSSWPHRVFDRAHEAKKKHGSNARAVYVSYRLYFTGQKKRDHLAAIDLPLEEVLT
jgi:hypothetical protein